MDTLLQLSLKAAEIIKLVPGAGDAEAEIKGTSPLLLIEPKTAALQEQGIAKQNVLSAVEIAIGGKEAGYLFKGMRRFPIIVRLIIAA